MKAKKKTYGIKHRIREEKKKEERIGLALTVAILIAVVVISGFLVNSFLHQPPVNQIVSSASEPKAAIVDHLSLTFPNQTFIQAATAILNQAGYTVDYYPGQKVTVEFYRNLATHGYEMVILRVHSCAAALKGKEHVEIPVSFFTSENYSRTKYVWEQLTDQLVIASYTMLQPPYYFAIKPNFVTSSMNGRLQDTVVVMMGCEGLNNTEMAEAFMQKGAKTYIGWKGSVLAPHTDQATTLLLQHLILDNQTIRQAIEATMEKIGPDPVYNSTLTYFPPEIGEHTTEACE